MFHFNTHVVSIWNVWNVIKAFKKDVTITNKKILDLRTGLNPEPPRKNLLSRI